MLGGGVSTAQAAAVQSGRARLVRIQGYLVASPITTTAPLTVQVQTPNLGLVTVTVTPNTRIVLRFGGLGQVGALSVNDVLNVTGQELERGAMTATVITDLSLQQSDTFFEGMITSVGGNVASTIVQRTWGGHNPFSYGQNVALPVGATTDIISGTTIVTGTAGMSLLSANERVYASGLYNRAGNMFSSVSRIRILPAQPPHLYREILRGFIATAPISTSAGMVFSLQTLDRGAYTVTVPMQAVVTRRYNGHTTASVLLMNDVVDVTSMVTSSSVTMLTARAVHDISIQAAYTSLIGRVLAVTPTSLSVIVQRNVRYSPFDIGQNLVLPVGPSTKVISGTTTITGSLALPQPVLVGQRVYAYGVFNRISQSFETAAVIRVLP